MTQTTKGPISSLAADPVLLSSYGVTKNVQSQPVAQKRSERISHDE